MPADATARGGAWLARAPSPLLVVGAITSVQLGSSLAAKLFVQVGPGGAVLFRQGWACLVLLALIRPRWRGRGCRDLLLAGAFGLVLAGMNTAFYEAIDRIPLGIGVTIEFVGPLGVALAGTRGRLDVVWVLLAALGILALLGGAPHGLDALGIVLALVAAGFWSLYIILNARLGRAFAGAEGLSLALCVAALAVLPVGLAQGGAALLHLRPLALGAAVGILSSLIPYTFEIEALRRIATNVFGVLMSLEPAVAALLGFLVLGQSLSARELAGIALVVIASVGVTRRSPGEVASPGVPT